VEQLSEVALSVNRLENDVRRLKRADPVDCSCHAQHPGEPAAPHLRVLASAT